MKLGALGLVTVVIGVVLSSVGLVGIGALWVLMGVVGVALKPRLTATAQEGAAPDGRRFALGTVVLLVVGVPSLMVGILGLGIAEQDAAWRWLPIGVGVLAAGIAVVSGLLYGAGAGLSAATGAGSTTVPATLWIRSVKETGQFVNERPRMEFVFRVEPDPGSGVAGYDAAKRATVPFTALAYLRVGDGFHAKVAGPDDPESMTIDWDSPVSATT